MMLYYQSLAIYFVALVIYVLLRLQFSGFEWNKVIHDSIFYLFLLLFGYVLVSTFYYLIKKKEIILDENQIIVRSNFSEVTIPFNKIESIMIKREKRFHLSGLLRTIKIKVKNGVNKTIVIRPFDYENEEDLLNEILKIRESLKKSIEEKNA
jgi:hypothetical protein